MLNSPDPALCALNFLKGKENPFASLARPQRLDDYFLDLHVPELLSREREQLWQIIDHYRVDDYTRAADLRPTRVVTILGDRGAGKTHLLQSLSYRRDGKSQILVRPGFFDGSVPIEEFLLAQLVSTLLAEDEVYGTRPIEDLARALTRRLLRQSLRSLAPTDRLFALSPSRWQRWRLLLGGGTRASLRIEELADALEKPVPSGDLSQLVQSHGLSSEQCFRLLCGHLRRFELKQDLRPDLQAALRCELYTAMGRSVFLADSDPLFRLLEGEYAQIGGGGSSRFEVVARMLHAVTEVCALVRQPIVFAFDNLERLFSPQNQFDGKWIGAFWNSLAQAVDNTKGLLVLLFAERGLFERASAPSYMDEFARARLVQGVPIYAQGPVFRIDLHPPSAAEIEVLVKGRIDRLLGQVPEKDRLPATFPFAPDFMQREASGSQNLRNTLLRLRDEYSRRVYEQSPVPMSPTAPAAAPAVQWEGLLEAKWNEHLAAAGRKAQGTLAGYRADMHAGLASLLERARPLDLSGWSLTAVQQSVSIGDNPTYGVASLLHWKHQADSSAENGALLRMGVAFLLAQKAGMAPDLRAKFDFFRRPAKGEQLLILWPAPRDGDDLVDLLPPGTRAAWDESRFRKKTTLVRVDLNDLRSLLCFSDWLNSLSAAADQPVPDDLLREFIEKHFQRLLQLVAPPALSEERASANED